MAVYYINTDLDLVSQSDLKPFASALEAQSLCTLHVENESNLRWVGRFETNVQYTDPETNISAMLDVIENLNPAILRDWEDCSAKEFNIGYASGRGPKQIVHRLNAQLLSRIARLGASVGITVYPIQDS